jgi:LysM repeat protein
MRFPASRFLAIAASVLVFAACTGKPENSPVLRKKLAELDKLTENSELLAADVKRLNGEIERLTTENSELRALVPGGDLSAASQKLSTIEARLNKIEGIAADKVLAAATPATKISAATETASTTQVASSSTTTILEEAPLATSTLPSVLPVNSAAAGTATTASKKADKPVVAAQQEAKSTVAKTEKKVEKKSAEKKPVEKKSADKKATRGAYHTIAVGETIDAVATKYGVKADDIRRANGLPAGARLAAGQRLFVPGAK